MGSRGPIGKTTRQRERDERRLREAEIVVAGKGRAAPKLPAGLTLSPTARAWWRVLWASPLSTEFREVDLPALVRLVSLWDRFVAGTATGAELAETRQIEDRFGLSVQARKRLHIRITQDDQSTERRVPPAALGARVVELRGRLDA